MLSLCLIVLRVRDLETSRCFFEALGCKLVPEQHGRGPRHYSFSFGELVVELFPALGKNTSDLRLGMRVSELSAVLAHVEDAGGVIVSRHQHTAIVKDPDGHTIELAQERPAELASIEQ